MSLVVGSLGMLMPTSPGGAGVVGRMGEPCRVLLVVLGEGLVTQGPGVDPGSVVGIFVWGKQSDPGMTVFTVVPVHVLGDAAARSVKVGEDPRVGAAGTSSSGSPLRKKDCR